MHERRDWWLRLSNVDIRWMVVCAEETVLKQQLVDYPHRGTTEVCGRTKLVTLQPF